MEHIDIIISRLEIDFDQQPMKILGLKATYQLMNQIYTTLFTMGFALAQRIVATSSAATTATAASAISSSSNSTVH